MGNHRQKIDEIETLLVNDAHIDIICLSEIWLDNQISDKMVKIKGYEIYRKDRAENMAGGAGMYITDALPHRRADEFEFPNINLLWVEVKYGKKN